MLFGSNTRRLCISVKRHSTLGLFVAAFCLFSSEIAFTIGMTATLWGTYSIISMKHAEFTSGAHVYNPAEMRLLLERFESEQMGGTSVHMAFGRAFEQRVV